MQGVPGRTGGATAGQEQHSKHRLSACSNRYNHRVHIFTRDETGLVCLPTAHCNFTGDGKCNERGWACTPHPHQPGLILPS
jgi:hypothetical protein